MSWPARTWITGEMVDDVMANAYWRDPLADLRAGGLSVSGQATNDFIYASTAAQLARVAAQTNKVPRWNGSTWEMVLPLELAWPVGSIFRSGVSTNPNTLLGFGTWAAFGTGRCTVAFDSGQVEFDTVRETGGAKTVALTEAEMPVHTHTQDSHNHTQNSHNHTQNSHDHTITNANSLVDVNVSGSETIFDNAGTVTTTSTVAVNQAATAVNQSTSAVNQSAGSGSAHNNLMPYIVAYVWERTA